MNPTEIVPLGTGSAVPVPGRSFSAVALVRQESAMLFDCGEGTQARLLEARIRFSKIKAVFITHLHGDHLFGLFGLLSTMSLLRREEGVAIAGPAGIREMVEAMPGLAGDDLSFVVRFVELHDDEKRIPVFEAAGYRVFARSVDHGVPSFGYRYEESPTPGSLDVDHARSLGVHRFEDFRALKAGMAVRSESGETVQPSEVVGPATPGGVFAYAGDTRPCAGVTDLAKNADILYHEATFSADMADRARETGHSTTVEAAAMARAAPARRLLLSHFSARYSDAATLVDEAREVFPATEAAEELRRYALQASEVGVEDR